MPQIFGTKEKVIGIQGCHSNGKTENQNFSTFLPKKNREQSEQIKLHKTHAFGTV